MNSLQPVTAGDSSQQLGILSRAPQRILAASTEDELREALGGCVRGLFRNVAQYELYARDDGGALVPLVSLGAGALGNGLRLLSAVKARITLRQEGGQLTDPHVFPAQLGVRRGSIMSAPLVDGELHIGLIVVESAPGVPDFTRADLGVLEGIAALFSLALQRLRAKELELAQARVGRDLKEARRVQKQLMSTALPPASGVTALAEYLPAFDVGGDFYDVGVLPDGRISAVIGDVSGKGVTAALVMSQVTSEFRRHRDRARTPAELLAAVNAGMVRDDSESFATAACFTLDPVARTLEVANAGHPPLIVRRTAGQVFTFGTASGTPLGMLPCEYASEFLSLEPGDIVLLMTDGLVEALDRPSDRLGMELLLGLIKYAPHEPRVIIERALAAVNKMKGSKLLDDVTLVTLQLRLY
jgi:sigma-B regulation protein RsbU (phosphoserine phosphatase)